MAQQKVKDTLIIKYDSGIKYIKFGERVYEVIQPSLKEVESIKFPQWGVGSLTVDSTYIYKPVWTLPYTLPMHNLTIQ
jgi:hypothetical protein